MTTKSTWFRTWFWGGLGCTLITSVTLASWLLLPGQASCRRTESKYVGAHRCKGCHEQAYKKWATSAHAKAYSILPAKSRNDLSCLKCHSTGQSNHLQGVQCESCHGGGKYYIQPEVMIDPLLSRTVGLKVIKGINGCKTCHTPETHKRKAFDYAKKWAQIAHGKTK